MTESNEENITLRIKIGGNELEINGQYSRVVEIINLLLPYLLQRNVENRGISISKEKSKPEEMPSPPSIAVKKGEPLTDIIKKLFNTEWGHSPHPLKEIIDMLNSYGLYYPKSTTAVTLNRLTQRGAIRRIKTKEKGFLYVSAEPIGGEE